MYCYFWSLKYIYIINENIILNKNLKKINIFNSILLYILNYYYFLKKKKRNVDLSKSMLNLKYKFTRKKKEKEKAFK